MNFGPDFIEILKTYKRLPFFSIEEAMATANEFAQEAKKLKEEN